MDLREKMYNLCAQTIKMFTLITAGLSGIKTTYMTYSINR